MGDPARREAYVGIKCSSNTVSKARTLSRASSDDVFGPASSTHGSITGAEIVLPRPLWGMV